MKTTEGNKLIAEFMGSSFKTYKKGHIRKNTVTVCYFDDGMSPFSGGVSIENLKYHASWDWLMPVVFRIIDLRHVYPEKRQRVFDSISPKIEKTWLAVCEFIKWYNENK